MAPPRSASARSAAARSDTAETPPLIGPPRRRTPLAEEWIAPPQRSLLNHKTRGSADEDSCFCWIRRLPLSHWARGSGRSKRGRACRCHADQQPHDAAVPAPEQALPVPVLSGCRWATSRSKAIMSPDSHAVPAGYVCALQPYGNSKSVGRS
ncbi:hypothetical protein AV530_015220 [Patagioenas fasciata monilis]|uniref:Uncharacterized protein n=1 Tax=Patagioenas fasciata monilis TaxID=372326 RepID=A0A1V4K1M0_PATFA|nr:hypothetical protein AV530_015220 [Patagioenas fasciata monilis]